MGLIERFRNRRISPGKVNGDGFQPTPQESSILEAFLPEDRGGFKGFCRALDWAGVSQERQRDLLEKYHTEKPKAMRLSANNEIKA